MDYIIRDKSLITGQNNLEHLYTLKDFPVFMGCVDTPPEKDIIADMVWDICRDTGLIQLRQLIPLDILYLDQHNDGTGQVWHDHYRQFANFIYSHNAGKNILEIGGAHDLIAQNYRELQPDTNWTTVEPNPQNIKDNRIKVIKGLFDENFIFDAKIDTIIHSHVWEHMYQPLKFMEHISNFLRPGQKHIFTFPNFLPMLANKQTNCLNFEHTVFLTEPITEYILQKYGFKILAKEYFGDPHSIFYATEKVEAPSDIPLPVNKYQEYQNLFMDFVNYHREMIEDLNQKIADAAGPVYLFGGHIFSQFLIKFGLQIDKIVSILDNSPLKIGKRLYGTTLSVDSPQVLKDKGQAKVILKAGIYNEEIKKDILENINGQVVFW